RRKPRICVVDQQAHIPSHVYTYVWKAHWQQATSQDSRIGVEVHAYAWKAHTSHVPESRLAKLKRDQDSPKP
ncbi:hypothetical protein PIB30_108674, partial [Stylosanthes scabra]|nr:hypothetical protein [Stylosanthes scabra]